MGSASSGFTVRMPIERDRERAVEFHETDTGEGEGGC